MNNAKEKQRIAFILLGAYPLFFPDENPAYGGAEIDTYSIATSLDKKLFDVHFIAGDFGQQKKTEIVHEITLYRGQKKNSGNIITSAQNFFRLATILLHVSPAVLFTKGVSWQTVEILLLGKITRSKIIVKSSHIRNIDGSLNRTLYGKIFFRLINLIDTFILQNEEDRSLFFNTFPHYRGDVITIRNFQEIPPRQARYFQKTAIWVGRSEPFKRPHLLIDLALLCPEWHFTMVMPKTNSMIFEKTRERVQKISNITFIPGASAHDLKSLYLQSSFLIATSENEGFPNTILESLKHSTPVLSFLNFDAIIETNQCGAIAKDITHMSEILQNQNETNWHVLSRNAHTTAKKYFDKNTGIIKYEKLFSSSK